MRYIEKLGSLPEFEQWKTTFKETHNRKTPTYDNLSKNTIIKQKLKEHLLKEQKGLCCYCCSRIEDINEDSHIEHIYPRHLCKTENKKKQVDYYNMVISCNGYIEEYSEETHEFCGHRKKEWYSETMISPIEESCEDKFTFTYNGEVRAKNDDVDARETIDKLGLDEYALRQARKSALEAIGFFEQDFDIEDAKSWIEQVDENGYLIEYYDMLKYILNKE